MILGVTVSRREVVQTSRAGLVDNAMLLLLSLSISQQVGWVIHYVVYLLAFASQVSKANSVECIVMQACVSS